MPSSSHESTLARQWEILKILPTGRPGISVRDLHDKLARSGHEVTRRTVERDLAGLCRVLPVTSNEISIPFGWHWLPGAKIDFPGMSLAEAVSLGLMEDLLRQLAPSYFTRALEGRLVLADSILKALPKNRSAKWADLVRYVPPGMPLQKPAIDDEVIATVQQALLEERQLKVDYRQPDADEADERVLHPLALLLQGGRPYLLATAFRYTDVRHYAIQRIERAEILDAPLKRPAGFSLDRFLAEGGGQFGGERIITLKATIDESLARLLEETPLSKDQRITTGAKVHTLSATVPDSWQLHFWILSQGAAITVVKPVALRKTIVSCLEDALGNYRL
jgi:predicted DNA-binding transcriptional regulator YafY